MEREVSGLTVSCFDFSIEVVDLSVNVLCGGDFVIDGVGVAEVFIFGPVSAGESFKKGNGAIGVYAKNDQ